MKIVAPTSETNYQNQFGLLNRLFIEYSFHLKQGLKMIILEIY